MKNKYLHEIGPKNNGVLLWKYKELKGEKNEQSSYNLRTKTPLNIL